MGRRKLLACIIFVLVALLATTTLACGSDDNGSTATDTSTKAEKKSSRDRTETDDGDDLPDADQIQEDLIGLSIEDPNLGEWNFESTEEFLEFDIEDSDVKGGSGDEESVEFVIEVKLEDINDGLQYNGQLEVTYERSSGNKPWRLSDVTGEYRSAQPSV